MLYVLFVAEYRSILKNVIGLCSVSIRVIIVLRMDSSLVEQDLTNLLDPNQEPHIVLDLPFKRQWPIRGI
jgi:hypothetical protein